VMEETDELNDLCSDLDELVSIIRSGVGEARALKNYEARENKLTYLEDRIGRAKTVYESLQLEIRSHGKDNEKMKRFRDRARQYKETINELIQETNAAKAEQGGAIRSTEEIMIQHSEKFSTGQLLQQGINVQEKSIQSVSRCHFRLYCC
jgi:chromosome segregation ATPase